MFTNNNVVDTEFYLLFKENDMDKIQKRIRTLIQNFANAGLQSKQTSNEDLRVILDNNFELINLSSESHFVKMPSISSHIALFDNSKLIFLPKISTFPSIVLSKIFALIFPFILLETSCKFILSF